jgi:outer membrane immunogenic protein
MKMYHIRVLAFTLTSVAALASANAADMYRAPEPFAGGGYKDVPVASWTGFYIGANAGYGWNSGSTTLKFTGVDGPGDAPDVNGKRSLNPEGGFGGGQIGYNWQGAVFGPRVVFGVEADIQGAGLTGKASQTLTNNVGVLFAGSAQSDLEWFGTVRGRLGYSFDRALVYFTGGFAFGGVKDTLTLRARDSDDVVTSVSKDKTQTGYVLGGGLEYAINPAWSLKGEYQYLNLGTDKLSGVADADGGEDRNKGSLSDHSYHTVRVGLNYHIQPGYEPLK